MGLKRHIVADTHLSGQKKGSQTFWVANRLDSMGKKGNQS